MVCLLFSIDLYQIAPGREAVQEECLDKAGSVLDDISNLTSNRGISCDIKNVANKLKASLQQEEIRNIIVLAGGMLWSCIPALSSQPDEIHSQFLSATHRLLASKDRDNIVELLRPVLPDYSDKVIQWFLADFIIRLGKPVELFLIRALQAPLQVLIKTVPSFSDRDNLDDLEFQETVHFIGGSSVKKILNKGMRAQLNDVWQKVVEVVKHKFLIGSLVTASFEIIMQWTVTQDRGGLKYINEGVWFFFMSLSGVLKEVEKEYGSVPHRHVICRVMNCNIMLALWSEIIEESLSCEDSDFLLEEIVAAFTNTWGNGLARRHKNSNVNLVHNKMPLRSTVGKA